MWSGGVIRSFSVPDSSTTEVGVSITSDTGVGEGETTVGVPVVNSARAGGIVAISDVLAIRVSDGVSEDGQMKKYPTPKMVIQPQTRHIETKAHPTTSQ